MKYVVKKQLITLIISCIFMSNLGGVIHVNASIDSNIDNVSSTSSVPVDNASESTTTTSKKSTTGTKTEKAKIGESKFNIVVSNDDMFTGLDTLIDAYTTEQYAPQISAETKATITKLLTSLVISVATGDSSYTLETFKDAFVKILVEHGVNVTDDVIEAIIKYATHYLDDEFENNETNVILDSIYISLGFITILLIALWQGGGSFR